ncbi:MAG TPA: hypothetical protein VFB60_00805 [Ktedonobacteraceae bacterium]|nr:hypothetical protein [Ktedonobacteraceae bacterium]
MREPRPSRRRDAIDRVRFSAVPHPEIVPIRYRASARLAPITSPRIAATFVATSHDESGSYSASNVLPVFPSVFLLAYPS